MNNINKKQITFIVFLFIVFNCFTFYWGFKSAIKLRSYFDNKLIPNLHEYYTKYKQNPKRGIYFEGFLKYMSVTNEEYQDFIMECMFEYETKLLMKWVIQEYLSGGEKILDLGGATGIQWKKFKDETIKKEIKVYITDISKHSIEWGKAHNKLPNIEFYHTEELDQIDNKNINLILLCEVYSQMDKGNQILKEYKQKFPNAKILVLHSVFKKNYKTPIINFFKKHLVKYTFLAEVYGRAMTDKEFKDEMKEVGLTIEKEYELQNLTRYQRVNNIVKAYLIS